MSFCCIFDIYDECSQSSIQTLGGFSTSSMHPTWSGMSCNEDSGDCLWVLELLHLQSQTVRRSWSFIVYIHTHRGSPQLMEGAHKGRPRAPFLLWPRLPALSSKLNPHSVVSLCLACSPSFLSGFWHQGTFFGNHCNTVSATNESSFIWYMNISLPTEECHFL